jgi:hypothetical protein
MQIVRRHVLAKYGIGLMTLMGGGMFQVLQKCKIGALTRHAIRDDATAFAQYRNARLWKTSGGVRCGLG